MSLKSRGGGEGNPPKNLVPKKVALFLCVGCFCAGMLFTGRISMELEPSSNGIMRNTASESEKLRLVSECCDLKMLQQKEMKRDPKGHYRRSFEDSECCTVSPDSSPWKTSQEFLLGRQ